MKLHVPYRRNMRGSGKPSWFTRVAVTLVVLLAVTPSPGQFSLSGEPSFGYFKAFSFLSEGEFADALEVFRENARLATRTVDGRWYDSVCYHTMMGECLYAAGNYSQALDQYNNALSIIAVNPGWLGRVQFPATVSPLKVSDRVQIPPPWNPADRSSMPGDFSSPYQVLVGSLDNSEVARRGGVIAPPQMQLLHVAEVVRCMAVALRRRVELLGPLCKADPFSANLVKLFEDAAGAGNNWWQAWHDLHYGLAMAGMGRSGDAAPALERAILINGTYTHPASGIALLQLGHLMAAEQRYQEAERFFLLASVAAAEFGQTSLVEEAFEEATVMHVFHDNQAPLVPLGVATEWARRQGYRHLLASLLVDSAENLASLGRVDEALALVTEARKARTRRNGLSASLSARLDHQTALVSFHTGKLAAAQAALADAIRWQQTCSPRLFQISVADQWYASRSRDRSSRLAGELYRELLREPTADDWIRETLDTLTIELTPHFGAYERWLELLVERGEIDRAFVVGEMLRRHRFYAAIPLGGRLLGLRWTLEAPPALLSAEALARRRDLQARFPAYATLSRRALDVRSQLNDLPWDELDDESRTSFDAGISELARLSELQELMLGEIALRREPVPLVFPPLVTTEALQQQLGPRRMALVFLEVRRGMHVFQISHDQVFHWYIVGWGRVQKEISSLLRTFGLVRDVGTVSEKVLENSTWQDSSASILEALVDRSQFGAWDRYDEMIIVPDGTLWYLPFEALQYRDRSTNTTADLGLRTLVTYAPAAGLIVSPRAPRNTARKTVVIVGKLFPQDDVKVVDERVSELQQVSPNVVSIRERSPVPSGLARCLWDRLVVFDEIAEARDGPLAWAPARFDRGHDDASLGRWLALPFGGPQEVILPGFRTEAETSGKGSLGGQEVYQSLMALMASGTRTVLLARWRTGGQSSYDLVRDYVQESGNLGPAEAWRRSTRILRQEKLDPAWEPRVVVPADYPAVDPNHPFFWAGYLLATQGEPVRNAETAEAAPANDTQAP